MRLGDLEQRILLACLARHQAKSDPPEPDVWRAELPGLLWGWNALCCWPGGQRVTYGVVHCLPGQLSKVEPIPAREYRVRQAALSRALTSLYDKGLIRFSFAFRGWYELEKPRRGHQGQAKSLRLTPLGLEVAFLRLTWKPRRRVRDVTPVYQVKSVTSDQGLSARARRKIQRQRRSWVTITSPLNGTAQKET